jgi:hypothetical protein
MLIRTLTVDKAAFISVELANKACAYLLTINTVEPIQEDNPFSYTTTVALLYTSIVFIGIVINTGVAKKLTAGHN